MEFGTQDRYNMTLSKMQFSELLRQALPWQPHISGKNNVIFPLASAVFTRLAWNLAHRTDITWRCEKWNFRNCYAKRCHGNHTSQKNNFSFINRYFRKLSLTFLTSIHFLTCMIISILVNILGQIGTAKWEGSTTGDGGTGSGGYMCSDAECSSCYYYRFLLLSIPKCPGGGGGTHVYWWYEGRATLTTPFFRPRFPFSRPPLRSISVPMPIKIVECSRAIAHPARSPGLKTPENSSLHCSLANLRCTHVTEVVMYNVLYY